MTPLNALSLPPSTRITPHEILNLRVHTLEEAAHKLVDYLHLSREEQERERPNIEKITREFHPPAGRPMNYKEFIQERLRSIQRELKRLQAKDTAISSQQISLDSLPENVLQHIATKCDRPTFKTLLLLSRKFHDTCENQYSPHPRHACQLVSGDPSRYTRFSPIIKMNPSVIKATIDKNPLSILDVPSELFEDKEDPDFGNLIKKMAYLRAHQKKFTHFCAKLIEEEPGTEKILPSFAEKVHKTSDKSFLRRIYKQTTSSSLSRRTPFDLSDLISRLPEKLDSEIARTLTYIYPLHSTEWAASQANDQQFIQQIILSFGIGLNLAPEHLKNNKEVILKVVDKNGDALQYVGDSLKNDREVVLAAVRQNGLALKYVNEALRNNKEVVLAAVNSNGVALEYVNQELKNDKEVVLAAVNSNGVALEYVSQELKNDKDVVLTAVNSNGMALQHAGQELKNDKEVVVNAVSGWGWTLKYASEALKNNKEVVLAAVSQSGFALEHASPELQNDREVVITAVTQDGYSLEHASLDLQNDREIALIAVNQDGNAIEHVGQELVYDEEIILISEQELEEFNSCLSKDSELNYDASECSSFTSEAQREQHLIGVKENGLVLQYFGEIAQNVKEIVLAAVFQNGLALEYASEALKNDKEIVLAAVLQNGLALEHASDELKNNKEIVVAAMRTNISAYHYASDELKKDFDITMEYLLASSPPESPK